MRRILTCAVAVAVLGAQLVTGAGPAAATPVTTVITWGSDPRSAGVPPDGVAGAVALAASSEDTPDGTRNAVVAVMADGRLRGWGADRYGNLTTLPTGSDFVAAAMHCGDGIALTRAGTVVPWGLNLGGEMNPPAGLTGVTAVAAGCHQGFALRSDGTVHTWGRTDIPPVPWPQWTGMTAISASNTHVLGLRSDGTVVGWGDNSFGESSAPAGLSGVVAVSAGQFFSLALRSNGTVVAWGDDRYGQTHVPGALAGVTAISAGRGFALALRSNGSIIGWGRDDHGQVEVPWVFDAVGVNATSDVGYALVRREPPVPGPATQLAVTNGDDQQVRPNSRFPVLLSVRVTDAAGLGVPGIPVTFSISGGATFAGGPTTTTVSTDTSGTARAPSLQAGRRIGEVTVTATAGSLPAASFDELISNELPR